MLVAILCFSVCTLKSASAPRVSVNAASTAFRYGAVPPDATAPKKLALLVGINHYLHEDRISPLAGSINDIEDMRQLLTTKFEFPAENVLTLKDSEATHAGIVAAIQSHLIAKAQAGDIVVFRHPEYGIMIKKVEHFTPDGESLFVVGTHPDSVDSRRFGAISRRDLIGKVIWHVRKPGTV